MYDCRGSVTDNCGLFLLSHSQETSSDDEGSQDGSQLPGAAEAALPSTETTVKGTISQPSNILSPPGTAMDAVVRARQLLAVQNMQCCIAPSARI